MARVVCVWEQGSNLGHLSHLKTPIRLALEQGHEVFLVSRELHGIETVFGDWPIVYLQAPFKHHQLGGDQRAFQSVTHIFFRQCFSSASELTSYIRAWRALFDLIQPDLVLFEHAPTALVASVGYGFKRVLVGNGFSIPPRPSGDSDPFAPFITTPSTPEVWRELRQDDAFVLELINVALADCGTGPLESLSQIYEQAHAQFLWTLPMLDHFGQRDADYLGVEVIPAQASPVWPEGEGKKVFAYLSSFQGLESLLGALKASQVSVLLFAKGIPFEMRKSFASNRMVFLDHLVDLHAVAQQVDWVITHGNHISVAIFAEAGIPQLVIPSHQEQLFLGLRLQNFGCGLLAFQDQANFDFEVNEMQSREDLARQAGALAQQCALLPKIDASSYIDKEIRRLLD